jgi:TolA-binding protein
MVWADAGDIDSAWAYFKTIGEQDSFYVMLERLGGIYASQGKNDKAIQVYARLLKEAPNRKTNPDVHLKLVELFDLVNRAPIAYTEAEEMTKLYLGDTTWTKKFPDETTETSSRIERNLHRYGASYHSRGIKTKSTDHLKVAARFYALYLQNFPKTEVAYEIRFYFAEILHEFNQYDPAAAQYMLVSRQNPTKGKYAKESATNAVVALNSLITAKTYPQLPPLGQVPSPLPIPQEKIRLVEALDNYIKHWGTDKESHPMYITAAKTYFDHGHYQPAIDRFIRTTDDIPGTLQAEAAARTVISYYSDKSEWANVVKWCQHFEKNEPLMKQAKVAEQIRTAYQAAAFNIAVNLEKEGKHADAAAAFVAYEGKFKGDKNSEKALFFASANLYRAGDIKRAIEVQNTFLQNYPKSDLRPDVLASLAETHEAIVQFKMAAGYYLELGQSYPTDKRAAASLMNASVLFRGVGDLKMAERALEGLVKGFPQSELLGDGILALAEVKESLGDNPEAKKHYDDFTKRYAKTRVEEALMAQARSAKIAQKSGSDTKGEAFKALTTALSKSPDLSAYEARALAAGTHFQAIEPRITAFKNMNINSEKLEDSIKAMQNELLSMSESYENVMSIGSGEYIVASLYRLGELHEIFADKMLNAPMAAQASATEINEIRSALEGLALPLKEEAYGYYETAFKRSSEVETFSIWTRLTYEKMSELQPSKNPEIDALITKPTYMTHKVLVSGSK